MPDYQGVQAWQDALKASMSGIFPDQAKQSLAYYHGAEARKAQAEAARLQSQQAAEAYLAQYTQPGLPLPSPMTWSPGSLPGFSPQLNPPANIPMSSVVPGPQAQQLPPGQTPAIMNPQAIVQAAPAVIAPLTQGTPPPMAPPSAVSPPAPTATGSNGSIVSNDPLSAVIHPASITDPNGGPKQTGPASSNGSPAPLPPNLNPQVLSTAAMMAGYDAQKAGLIGTQAVGEAYRQGRFDKHNFQAMLATSGQPTPYTTQIQSDVALQGHQLSAGAQRYTADQHLAATIGAAKIREAEARYQFENTPKEVMVGGVPTYARQIEAPGQPVFSPSLEVAREGQNVPKEVQPGGLGTPVYLERANTAIANRSPLYQGPVEQVAAQERLKRGPYVDPMDPLRVMNMSSEQATALGWEPKPTSPGETQEMFQRAIGRAKTDEERQALTEKYMGMATLPKDVPADEGFARRQVAHRLIQEAYPQPDPTTAVDMFVKDPVALTPEAQDLVSQRTQDLMIKNRRLAGDYTTATQQAIRELQREGKLYTAAEVATQRRESIRDPRGGDPRIQVVQPAGAKVATPHMMIGLKPPGGGATGGAGAGGATTTTPAPKTRATGLGPMPATAAPAATAPARPVPGTVLGPARPGTPDGPRTITNPDGSVTNVVVTNGQVIVQ